MKSETPARPRSTKTPKRRETLLRGIAVSPGIAIGPAFGFDHNFGAAPGAQHHQPHDGNGGHALPITQYIHASRIAFRQGNQLRRRAGMQAATIRNNNAAAQYHAVRKRGRGSFVHSLVLPFCLAPATSRARAIYFRPAALA